MKLKNLRKVAIIGLGYVGLPEMVVISQSGKYQVVGFDIDEGKIEKIKNGIDPINDEIVSKYLAKNKLTVSAQDKILANCDYFIICVPTPIYKDYTPDYRPVEGASQIVGKYLKKGCQVILESTVNPGTCEEIVKPILEKESGLKAGVDFNLAHCPERINPGDPKWNVTNIPRNIGSINKQWNKIVANFYRSFIKAEINEMGSLKVAEATKIVENTFRDINIAYVNELAQSFDAMGIDLIETLEASSNKPFAFLPHWPGCGVGGHCIAVDPYYLIKRAGQDGFDHRFLKIAREINNSMPKYTVHKLMMALNEIGKSIKGTKITLLGLSYKANIADLRESPALEIKEELLKLGADLTCYDPYIKNSKIKTLAKAIEKSQAIIIATNHQEFVDNLPKLLAKTKVKVLIDGKNCLPKKEIEKLGIIYRGIGR